MRFTLFLVSFLCVLAAGADKTKVQVFLLMGQSNMLGEGKRFGMENGTLEFAVKVEHKYPYLWDKSTGKWTVAKNIRNVFVMASGNVSFSPHQLLNNEWMTNGPTNKRRTIGPELGIGFVVGNNTSSGTMILKGCIGNRALGWDLLPPGSPEWNYPDAHNSSLIWTYAGYHQSPEKWPKGTKPKPIDWEAGEQYDGDTSRMAHILSHFNTYYPSSEPRDYEIAGIFWWQGDRDRYDVGHAAHYEVNLVRLIKTLRKQFNAPKSKFVLATLGQDVIGKAKGNDALILKAMLDVDGNSGKYPEFKGNVATVYSHPLSMGGASNSHYNHNAETYMNVGQAMGEAMLRLLKEA